MVAVLIAGALFTQQLLWTPISAINMTDIVSNQFKMSNASFSGTDTNGEPFYIHAATGRQEYDKPDIILLDDVSGNTIRITDGKKIKDDIKADTGYYDRVKKTITLMLTECCRLMAKQGHTFNTQHAGLNQFYQKLF